MWKTKKNWGKKRREQSKKDEEWDDEVGRKEMVIWRSTKTKKKPDGGKRR